MKTDEVLHHIKESVSSATRYLRLEVEYAKLTAAEKLTLLLGGIVFGFVMIILVSFMVFIMSLALADAFKLIMAPWLSYLCVAAVYLLLAIITATFRKHIILDPLARFISKIFIERHKDADKQ